MKEIRNKTRISNGIYQMSGYRCFLKEIVLGLAVVFIILFVAAIFAN